MTIYIIANPHAGRHQARLIVEQIKELSSAQDIKSFYTRYKDDERRQVNTILQDFQEKDFLLIIGGDGTLSKVLYYLPENIPFAYYPTGSGNDFARALAIPSNLNSILTLIQSRSVREMTVFVYEKGLLLNSLDVGFAARVIHKAEGSALKTILNKYRLGRLTYLAVAAKSLFSNPTADITVKNKDGSIKHYNKSFFFSLANNTYFGGGIMIWPTASVFDKKLDFIYARGETFSRRIRILLALVLKKHQKSPYLHHEKIEEVSLEMPKDTLIEIDGEIVTTEKITLKAQKRYIYL
ncbi:diacylglycerol kinase family protein [Streptococcus sp. H49]|uniref:diacylglycerol/lipid kinase family protein n=1 Tax=Streptococcus huangxiaojuni TaxID=3237239 RepID=UPI0034A23258